jgi:S-DNA-T family DNA segregation ATPase FtsK/SpoIIIE
MRLTLTVVAPARDARADVVVDADPNTPVRAVVKALAAQVYAESGGPDPGSDSAPKPDPGSGGGAGYRLAADGGFTPPSRLAPDLHPPRRRLDRGVPARPGAPPVPDGEIVAFVGATPVDPAAPLSDAGLRDGAVVGLGSPAGRPPTTPAEPAWATEPSGAAGASGAVELRVTGGPGAGTVHRLGPGEHDVGSDESCAVALADPLVPTLALSVTVVADGTVLLDPASGVEVLIDGELAPPGGRAGPGAAIAVGSVLLEVAASSRPDAAVRRCDDGCGLDVNRPPRLLPPLRETLFRLPGEPAEPERRPMPILLAALPAAAGVAMALLLDSYYFLLFTLVAPLSLIGSHVSGGRQERRAHRRRLADYRRRRDEVHADARDALAAERAARRRDHPDPATVLLTAVGPGRRLWERRRADPDYLHLRLGTADAPSEVVLEDPAAAEHRRRRRWRAADVPVTVALTERGVLGVAGRGAFAQVLGSWLLAQAAVLHSPRNLAIYVLAAPAGTDRPSRSHDPAGADRLTRSSSDRPTRSPGPARTDRLGRSPRPAGERAWGWVRWLPHCRPAEGQDTAVLIGTDDESRARRIGELGALIAARSAARAHGAGTAPPAPDGGPDVLVLIDGARALRSLPGMISVLRDGPAVGVYSICLDADVRLLPEECHAVAEQTPGGLRLTQMRSEVVHDARPDLVNTTARIGPTGRRIDADTGRDADIDADAAADIDVAGAAAWCEQLARALAPLRDVAADETTIPASARLLDVLGLEPPTAAAISARWAASSPRSTASPGSTAFPIGVSLDGPIALDLRRDGPHGLIAGTTGAGKSELLQSIVASLATVNRPDAMTFVLIDYKGGSAFADCIALPHTVGMVTDLDPHLVERALTSLGAELRRRERILAAVGAKDIDDYGLLAARATPAAPGPGRGGRGPNRGVGGPGGGGRGPGRSVGGPGRAGRLEPLPRLLLVVDEFASLARELPGFVTGLVDVAQRGRSLGIHLLLATQRPSGVVSAEIRANTNLRIALRVTDAAESTDVIDAPDAARISKSTPGRAFVRLGHSALVPFQAARVGGRRARPAPTAGVASPVSAADATGTAGTAGTAPAAGTAHAAGAARPPWTARLDWPALGQPAPTPPRPAVGDGETTDLRVLVSAICAATAATGVPAQPSPWLPPLPTQITVADLLAAPPPTGWGPAAVPIGLSDHPDAQAQLPFTVDVEHGGHLLIVGSPRSGRSTALRTLAGAIAATTASSQVHLYAIDCGNNALAGLATLPHTGAVVGRDAAERVQRLLARLLGEVVARQDSFATRGYADLAEQRAAEGAGGLPYLVLLVDRFEGFLAAFDDIDGAALVEALLRLLREGPAVGLRVVVTTDRRGLTGRLSSAIEDRLVLRLADKADYPLAGLPPAAAPDALPPGRGFRLGGAGAGVRDGRGAGAGGAGGEGGAGGAGVVETQLALLDHDPSGRAQTAALKALAARAAKRDGLPPGPATTGIRTDHRRPFRVDVLPARISLADAVATRRPAAPPPPPSPRPRPSTAPQPPPTAPQPPPPQQPRSMTALIGVGGDELAAVEADLAADGPGFVVAGPARSGRSTTLLAMAKTLLDAGARLALVLPRRSPLADLAGAAGIVAVLDADDLSARPDALDALAGGGGATRTPLAIVVDDAELLDGTPIAARLTEFLRGARDAGSCLLAAGTTEDLLGQFRGFMVDARRSRCGVLLAPTAPAEGELFGVRLSRTFGGAVPPGRGLLFRRGNTIPVQVADPA